MLKLPNMEHKTTEKYISASETVRLNLVVEEANRNSSVANRKEHAGIN